MGNLHLIDVFLATFLERQMKKYIAACAISAVCFASADAADRWQKIAPLAFLDVASIRTDSFPGRNGMEILVNEPQSVHVAWVKIEGIKIEVVFDCVGKVAPMQQIVPNDSAASKYHSFDDTEKFRETGVMFSSIVPDSVYQLAQPIVCAK